MVGLGRFELPTSRLSGGRSNQLSYRPALANRAPVLLRASNDDAQQRNGNCFRSPKTE